jgi:hypothetical protein
MYNPFAEKRHAMAVADCTGGLMDPTTVAAGVVALLSPYVKKAAEDFAGEAGKYVFEKAKLLWGRLQTKFQGEQSTRQVLERFVADPDGNGEQLRAKIEEKLAQDPQLADELSAALADIKRAAPNVKVVQKVKDAEELIGVKARRISRGNVDVSQEADKVKKATGAEFDEIG